MDKSLSAIKSIEIYPIQLESIEHLRCDVITCHTSFHVGIQIVLMAISAFMGGESNLDRVG